jgi:predicted  nucleic acid-binding Zn-ribbon protein
MNQPNDRTTAAPRAQAGAKRARRVPDGRKDGQGDSDRTQPTEGASAPVTSREEQLENEVQQLRARLGALESELLETQAQANAAVAEWQERAYWLDRWHLDLNALMRRQGAAELRAAIRAVRPLFRWLRQARRQLQRSLPRQR